MRAKILAPTIMTAYVQQRYFMARTLPALIASVVLILAMAILGRWADHRVQEGALQRAASETVLDMDNYIKPLVQGLAQDSTLSAAAQGALSVVLGRKVLGRDVAAIKIWSPFGSILYSNRPELIGRTYPLFDNLQRAFTGAVVAQFDDLDDDENEFERSLGDGLLEIYAPVRESGTNRIIAVAEIYERREDLRIALQNMQMQTWMVIGSLTLAIIGLWAGVTFAHNRQELKRQVVKLCSIHRKMTEINELFLRRVSAELHDAPAQLIGFVLLRLEALQPQLTATGPGNQGPTQRPDLYETIHSALVTSLNEIRYISAGLAPPELTDLSLVQALQMAASLHYERTGTEVSSEIGELPDAVDPTLKISLYRFAQEGLNNAFRHADGRGQALRAIYEDGLLEVTVSDAGPVAQSSVNRAFGSGGLGLAGLRGRIESLGGSFEFISQPGLGARVTARFTLATMALDYA